MRISKEIKKNNKKNKKVINEVNVINDQNTSYKKLKHSQNELICILLEKNFSFLWMELHINFVFDRPPLLSLL